MSTPSVVSADSKSQSVGEFSPWEVLAVLVRGRRTIIGFVIGLGLLSLGVALLMPREWVVETTFRPQAAESSLGQISSLASQFGVNVMGQGKGDTPEFYRDFVVSRALLGAVASRRFSISAGDSATLEQILEFDDPSPDVQRSEVIAWLKESAVSSSLARETGVVSLVVNSRWPELSAQLAGAILEELNRFNLETRQSQATAERGFVEERLSAVRSDLVLAEGELKKFLQVNRSFEDSPQLRFEHERLQREVVLRQQLFTNLSEAYEQARISEVRDTPVITVIQKPYLPPKPKPRGLLVRLLLGSFLGGLLGVLVAFAQQLEAPSGRDERRAYDEVLSFVASLRPWRARN